MPVDTDGQEAVQRFQSLSLSIPLDPSQFDYIKQFLQCLLNVDDITTIANSSDVSLKSLNHESPEILPDIYFPNDIWLRNNVVIRDMKLKVTMLNEVNTMLKAECAKFSEPLDETTLLYYQKVLVAYKLYDSPARPHYSSELSNDFSVKEELDEETEEFPMDERRSLNRTHSNGSSITSLKTHMSFFSHSSTNLNGGSNANSNGNAINFNNLNGSQNNNITSKRGSTGSKESGMTRKRFLSFVGGNHQNNSNTNSGHTTMAYVIDPNASFEEVSEDEQKKQQALNGILSKSRIYNKIKKNRELSSSVNSNVSLPSLAYSSRNSVSTTATANSNASKSRRSSNVTTPDNTDLKHASYNPIPIFATYSSTQKQDNQKQKYEYYVQVAQLLKIVEQILHHLRLNHKDAKAFKLMDFIKRFIFKFIVFDASEMVMTYGEIEAYQLYNRLTN